MDRSSGLKLSAAELDAMFGDEHWSRIFPPVLDIKTAARMAGVPEATIYDWSSRGLLKGCARRKGKRLRILRNRFAQFLFS